MFSCRTSSEFGPSVPRPTVSITSWTHTPTFNIRKRSRWWTSPDPAWAWWVSDLQVQKTDGALTLRTTQVWKHPLNVKISPETEEGELRAPPTRRSLSTAQSCSLHQGLINHIWTLRSFKLPHLKTKCTFYSFTKDPELFFHRRFPPSHERGVTVLVERLISGLFCSPDFSWIALLSNVEVFF